MRGSVPDAGGLVAAMWLQARGRSLRCLRLFGSGRLWVRAE